MIRELIEDIKSIYGREEFIPLHTPCLSSIDKDLVIDCLDSTFVSSVGKYVDKFEEEIQCFTGVKKAVATMNGTAALHTALHLMGVKYNDEVICQPFTFIATTNAIKYCGAYPVFVDIEKEYMSLCPDKLKSFLKNNTKTVNGELFNSSTSRRIKAVVVMHSFGMPAKMLELVAVCKEYGIKLIEDAAESLGSTVDDLQTGTFGDIGIYSFNGNKIITCGGGGMIVTNNEELGIRAKHITTTAKLSHQWEYNHDEVGYNYRMPNLNAALGVAQMSKLNAFIALKREVADKYSKLFEKYDDFSVFKESNNRKSNYWLNALIFNNVKDRTSFLEQSNTNNVMTRPPWGLICDQKPYKDCFVSEIPVSRDLVQRVVNIPSSVIGYEG